MHELSLCRSVYDVVVRAASGRTVEEVQLQVGQLRQVVPETLAYCWGLVVEGTPLAGSHLAIDHVPVRISCRDCQEQCELATALLLHCEACGSPQVDVVTGEEFMVTSLQVKKDSIPQHCEEPT